MSGVLDANMHVLGVLGANSIADMHLCVLELPVKLV
jgi:hypothetical protein